MNSIFNSSKIPKTNKATILKKIHRHWQLYLLLLPPLVYLILFKYVPMYGIQIAFKDFNPGLGIIESKWVGFKFIKLFLDSPYFGRLIKNTMTISITSIVISFPVPIILAVSINECRSRILRKTVQMITYMPYFISTVILVSMMMQITSSFGLINNIRILFGLDKVNIMNNPNSFLPLYVGSGIWQGAGYSAVIYIVALSGVNSELYESAFIDGASIIKKIIYIDIPSIMPTAVILLILNSGNILNVGFEKVFMMQNPLNMNATDVISTFVYRIGLESAQYSFSAAVGLFNSIISTIVIIFVNWIAKRLSETSLW